MPPDSMYYPDVIGDPDDFYRRLAAELRFDPETGRSSEEVEMPIIEGEARHVPGSTAFHPVQARQTQSQWHGVRPVPHRHAYFATSSDLREPKQSTVNRSMRNVEALQPVIPFSDVPVVDEIRRQVAAFLNVDADFFNFANANLYWSGDDSKLGNHQDQDLRFPVMEGPLTASVTFNEPGSQNPRVYEYASQDAAHPIVSILLRSGSLNILGRIANHTATHGIPAQKGSCTRLSLNFRHVPESNRKREASAEQTSSALKDPRKFRRLHQPTASPIDLG